MSLQPYISKAADRKLSGNPVACLASGVTTGESFALYEETVPPGGGPPLHVHTREDEAFYIIEGELTLVIGDATHVGGPGDFVFAPRNIPHRFFNSGAVPCKFILMITPAGFEKFLAEYAVLMGQGQKDMAPLVELGNRYGLTFL